MLDLLVPWSGQLILTKYQKNPRGVPLERLKKAVEKHGLSNVLTAENPAEAIQLAISGASPDTLICVTGSFYLAAEALEVIRPE